MMESCHSVVRYDGAAKPLTTNNTTNLLCDPPVYSTLGHLIAIIEQLRCRNVQQCNGVMDGGLARNALRILLECDNTITDKMAVNAPNKSGTPSGTITTSVIENLEMELKKLQQNKDSYCQEIADQQKKIKNLEQKLKPCQEKNKKFLEKNMELTMLNRTLKDQMSACTEENKKLKEQCENSKKRVKQLNMMLNHEKMERGSVELQLQELNNLKQQVTELNKSNAALRQACIGKDRRIDLIQHRKKRKRLLRSQNVDKSQRVKETFFGYDEDTTSVDSEASSSLSLGTLSDDELCDELSREEIETNYQRLMKEYMDLQKLHALLQNQAGSHLDPQRENRLRSQIEADLFSAQCKIEELQELLRQHDEELHSCRSKNTELQSLVKSLKQENKDLEDDRNKTKLELCEAKEAADNLEFRIVELESQQGSDRPNDSYHFLETIPEDPLEMSDAREGALAPPPYDREGAESPEVMGYRLQEQEVHIKDLEQTASELQKKISSLQQEKVRLEDKLIKGVEGPSLEEREAQEVLELKETETNNHGNETPTQVMAVDGNTKVIHSGDGVVCGDVPRCDQSVQTNSTETKDSESQVSDECLPIAEPVAMDTSLTQSPQCGEFLELNSYITLLQQDFNKLREENFLIRSHLQDTSCNLEDLSNSLNGDSTETKMADMLMICENLQDRICCYETTERQLRDKLKMMEWTVNEFEANDTLLRDQLEEIKQSDMKARRMSSSANHKIAELKELILDKDVIEMNLGEKVQFLEKAETISSQKIAELEARNHFLQQRIDLKEDLEADVHFVETLKEKVGELQSENNELNIKISELEENEEILRTNWMKVAENDANRIQSLEEKVKVLETCNKELRTRLREHQDRSPMPESSVGTSIAVELTESENMNSSLSEESEDPLQTMQKRYRMLEQELHTIEESKNAKIESLQERIAYLKENEIKLSETLVEMENEEREIRSRLNIYERQGTRGTKLQYEDKIKALKSSQENLLDRLDSMEEHEDNLKIQIKELERSHEAKLDQYEREIAKYMEQEEVMVNKIQEIEKHETELMEKVEELETLKSELEAENETLNNQMDRYFEHEKELIENSDMLQQARDTAQQQLGKTIEKCEILEKNIHECEEENFVLSGKLDELTTENEQIRSENDDLNERVIELDSSEQELLEKLQKLERRNANIKHLEQKVEVLEDAECRLMDRVTELEEVEQTLRSRLESQGKDKTILGEVENNYKEVASFEGRETKSETSKEGSVLHKSEFLDFCDQATDTNDLVDNGQGHKVTGQLFERLQELESENQNLSEKLSALTATDAQVRQLSEKVKLLENAEDRLMERVMELEDVEDRMKRELVKAKASASSVPDFDEDIEAMQKSDIDLRENINALQNEKEDIRGKLIIVEETVLKLKNEIKQLEKELSNEKEVVKKEKDTVNILKDGERKLVKIIETEKSKCKDLESELSNTQDKLEEVQTEYETKLSDMESVLQHQTEESTKTLKSEINSLVKEKQIFLERIDELQQSQNQTSECSSQQITIQDFKPTEPQMTNDIDSSSDNLQSSNQIQNKSCNQESAHSSHVTNSIPSVTVQSNKDSMSSDFADDSHSSAFIKLNLKCQEMEQIIRDKSKDEEIHLHKISELEKMLENVKLHSDGVTARHTVNYSADKTECSDTASQTDFDKTVSADKVLQLEDQICAFHNVIKDIIGDLDEDLLRDGYEGRLSGSGQTFLSTSSIPACIEGTNRDCLVDLLQCKACIRDRLVHLHTQSRDLKEKEKSLAEIQEHLKELKTSKEILKTRVEELEQSESSLQRSIRDVHTLELSNTSLQRKLQDLEISYNSTQEKLSQLNSVQITNKTLQLEIQTLQTSNSTLQKKLDDAVQKSTTKTFGVDNKEVSPETRTLELETSEKILKERLEAPEGTKMGTIDKPEDILRQRIGELERLEKHLKQQVVDMERDREELHDIARKDKNIIHDQNVRIRELQLSEKNLKEQMNQFEVSERSLYNKVEELEDNISKMEDRISELKILEMRLKELVRKYKLDEEVWLNKSENLETSMTELSVSEAKLKKTVQSLEQEKQGLAEKSEYLELRLKELQNAESNLMQRVKDQENKEISMNNKLAEIQKYGSVAELQNSELQAVNIDLSQRFNHAAQENAALTHHMTQLQNQLHVLDQQVISLKDSELRLKQEVESLEKNEAELHKKLKDTQIQDIDNQAKVRQVEEGEAILKDKISMLQRSENRLKYRVKELESCGTQMPLEIPNSQKDRIPRKLEDCQRRIIVLQNQNEKLKERIQDYQNISTSKSAVKLPLREYQDMQSKVALLEQTELHLDEVEQTNAQLMEELNRLKEDPDVSSHKSSLEDIQKRLEQSNKTTQTLRRLINERQCDTVGPVLYKNPDQQIVSNSMYRETAGRLAERGSKGKGQMSMSAGAGHHVQKNDEELLDNLSDASTAEEDIIGKTVRGNKNAHNKRGLATTENREQMINDLVSHLESSVNYPLEEAHWRTVESLSPRATEQVQRNSEKGQVIGRATSLNTNGNTKSHLYPDEELVLGVTFPSESESQWYSTQNDTDSTMSPLMKRRKFRPTESVDSNTAAPPLPQTLPPNLHNSFTTNCEDFEEAEVIHPNFAHASSDDNMQEECYMQTSSSLHAPVNRKDNYTQGTTSRSALKSQKLKQRIADVESALQKRVGFGETTDDEDTVMSWRQKTSEAMRQIENYEKETKHLKEEHPPSVRRKAKINKLEKELEDKSRYIYILEQFLDKLSEVLQMKDEKSAKEIVQIIEAELEKVHHELTDSGHRKLDLSKDIVALNTELGKRERELVAKRNEVDSLMRELRQWQEECRTIEDMRNSALDSLHCLEVEAGEVQNLEMSLKEAKDEHNRITGQCRLLQERIKDLELIQTEKDDLQDQVDHLRSEVKVIAHLQEENAMLERRMDESSKLIDNRSEKVKELICEVSHLKGRVVSLEQDKMRQQRELVGYDNIKSQFDEMKSSKDDAVVALAPLRAKVNRLSEKCKAKDDFIKKLGEELRKMKGVGKPVVLLEELRHMEDMMVAEEYNTASKNPLQSSAPDLERSLSTSSLSDNQDPGVFSDSETTLKHSEHNGYRPRSADQWDRHQKPLPLHHKQHKQDQWHSTSELRRGRDKHTPGYFPQDTMFVAVADYNPSSFSMSGRPSLELALNEGDHVRITGPLDEHGYYEAEVKGQVGLVPANFLRPCQVDMQSLQLSPRQRQQRELQTTPAHHDPSPEKILQMHSQLQQSHAPRRQSPHVNGFLHNSLSPRTSNGQRSHVLAQQSSRYRLGVPEAPSNLKVEKIIDNRSALLTWTPPPLNELAQSNNSQVIGYKIYLNGKVHHQVNSPHLTKAIVEKLDIARPLKFGIQTLTTAGPVSVVKEITYHHGGKEDIRDIENNEEEDIPRILQSDEFTRGRKRMFMGVYDYDPSHQSPRQIPSYELGFRAGDVITVYGKERPDGYHYGEINGRRGLVPAIFMEEVPLMTPVSTKHTSKGSHTTDAYRGQREVKSMVTNPQKSPRGHTD